MNTLLRWLLRLLGLMVAVAIAAFALGWYLVGRSLPDYSADLTVAGLGAPVTITRDANAVPHIRAESAGDAFYALGVVHAQDRLWQMEMNRRSAQGRLAAYLGPQLVALDRMVKTLDLGGYARRAFEHQTDETKAALQSYADGVNAWIRHVNANALGRGAPEFFLFAEEGLSPWTPQDSLAILKMMALRLSASAQNEIRRGRFLLDLPAERVADILPDYPGAARLAPPRFASLFPGAEFGPRQATVVDDPILAALGPPPRPEHAGASNAWAVDGTRSSSGAPLLASDPHLWLGAPTLWYLVDMQGGDLAAIGGTLPGTPAVLIGRNRRIGWGMTTANVDDQDVYIHRVNPQDPGQYRGPDGWIDFQTRLIKIDVAGSAPVVETALITRHGPVLSHNMMGVDAVTPTDHVAALAWTALEDRDRSMSAAIGVMQSSTLEDAVSAASLALAPAQNLVLADRERVAMVTAGAIPIRERQSPSLGRIPSPGWVRRNDWVGIQPFARNPRVIDPPTGAVANANNRISDRLYPDHISFDWDAPYRMERLEKELSSRAFHSRDSFVALQNDAVSEMARSILPLIAQGLWWRGASLTAQDEDAAEMKRQALEMLASWNGEMDQHGPEPLIFAEWMRQLTRWLAADELGALLPDVEGLRPLFVERVFRNIDGAAAWCDIDKTPAQESCAFIAEAALDDALARLKRDHGSNVEGWRWGAAHQAQHRHVPLGFGAFGPLGLLVSILQETSGGNFTLLRGHTPGRGDAPFENVHAAGLRVVYDFADLDRSVMIIATGQAGHPFSRWYDHLAGLWARGDVIPMSMDDEDARTGAIGSMVLRPGG
ncbi:MAG: penicillin acylase family protein [Pseudomonadota bacterium]